MKRRPSGSNLIGGNEHNQTQPLDLKKLRKIASISPTKPNGAEVVLKGAKKHNRKKLVFEERDEVEENYDEELERENYEQYENVGNEAN